MSQPPLSEDAKFVLRGLIIMTAIATLVGVALALVMGVGLPGSGRGGSREGGTDGWQTYRNQQYAYEVRYPPDWQLVERPALRDADGFETQSIDLTANIARSDSSLQPNVRVFVNLQGDWCVGAPDSRNETQPITVSGATGRQDICYTTGAIPCRPGGTEICNVPCQPAPSCETEPAQIVRYFPNAKGRQNYVVMGHPNGDAGTVRRIVESFRFLD